MTPIQQEQIELIFGSSPRTGFAKQTFWWGQRSEDEELLSHVYEKGKSLCIDGPTGSGKTSLAMHALQKHGFNFARVTISPSMDWVAMCKEIVTIPSGQKKDETFRLNFGVNHFVPTASLDIGSKSSTTPLSEIEFANHYLQAFSAHDMARLLERTKTCLVLDDFENADQFLVQRIATLMKLLSAAEHSREAKVIVTATNNAFSRLLKSEPTLRGRIQACHLGALTKRNDAWKFIIEGLDALGIRHPANSIFPEEKTQIKECCDLVYDACAGILKDITYLGSLLASISLERRSLKANEIKRECLRLARNSVAEHTLAFSTPIGCIVEHPPVQDLLHLLYKRGIGGVYSVLDVAGLLSGIATFEQVTMAIGILVSKDILVQTGLHEGVLFPRDAALLHALCLACSDPALYGASKEFFPTKQLRLVFRDERAPLPVPGGGSALIELTSTQTEEFRNLCTRYLRASYSEFPEQIERVISHLEEICGVNVFAEWNRQIASLELNWEDVYNKLDKIVLTHISPPLDGFAEHIP